MKPTTVTLDDLFRPQRRYVIPLFQRGYVWNEQDHWAPLWRDIVLQVRKVEDADKAGRRADSIQRHFLGAIVLEPKSTLVRHVADHAVIDGQQRLTTLLLVLAAFRDVTAGVPDEHLLRDLRLLTFNDGAWASSDETHKIWPTNVGRAAWRQVVDAGTADEVRNRFPLVRRKRKRKTDPRHPIAAAYLYFHDQIQPYLVGGPGVVTEEEDPEGAHAPAAAAPTKETSRIDLERANYLFTALSRFFQIVAIELEPTDDPQVIFETLNGRMAPLTAADLIRNFVFVAARDIDTESLYEETWSRFDHDPGTSPDTPGFWRGVQAQGRRTYPRLDLFVFHYVTMRTGREVALKRLFQAFRTWWEEGDAGPDGTPVELGSRGRDPAKELRRMVRVSDDMRALLAPGDASTDTLARFAWRLHTLDTTTPYPVLLYLAEHRQSMGDVEYFGCLLDLESYLIRRALCQLTSKNYNHVMLGALGALRAESSPSRGVLQRFLLGLQGEASRWPEDADVRQMAVLNPLYVTLQPARTQMILQALELAQYTGKEEGVKVPWVTVEHVMPQQPSSVADWPFKDGATTPTVEQTQARSVLRETLGNLSLVSQPLNSSLSNGPFSAKKEKLAAESQLRLNRYFAPFGGEHWYEHDIIERGKMLASQTLQVWPRPTAI